MMQILTCLTESIFILENRVHFYDVSHHLYNWAISRSVDKFSNQFFFISSG